MLKLPFTPKSLVMSLALALVAFVLLLAVPQKLQARPQNGICTRYFQGHIDGPVIGESGTFCNGSLNVWGTTSPYHEVYDYCAQ